jgi:precorrin-3B synthase
MKMVVQRGWCPTLYDPMATGCGLMIRVKPPNATLTRDAALELAAATMRYGRGTIELTSRAAVQVRGLSQDSIIPFTKAMIAAGLANDDPEVERHRSVFTVAPLAGDTVRTVVAAIESALHCDPRLAVLPPKFGIAVDCGDRLPLCDIGADIHVSCGYPSCKITLMGTGESAAVTVCEVPARVVQLARRLQERPVQRRLVPRAFNAIGWLPCGAFGVGLPFGSATASTLVSLADVSQAIGDGTLRTTPWRALIIPDVSSHGVRLVRRVGAELRLIIDRVDPRLSIFACPGQPDCPSATVPARADAERLVELGLSGTIHVSGCAKGCAHPGPAPVTVVGENGRYNIVRNGHPGDAPLANNLTLSQLIAALRE